MTLQLTLKSKSNLFTYIHSNNNETMAKAFCSMHYPDYQVIAIERLHIELENISTRKTVCIARALKPKMKLPRTSVVG